MVGPQVRDSILAAFIPFGLVTLAIAILILPRDVFTSFHVLTSVGLYLAVALLDGCYLTRKYKIGRETIVFFTALIGVIIIVLSYVPYQVQVIAYAITLTTCLVMYARILVEFRRRKYV